MSKPEHPQGPGVTGDDQIGQLLRLAGRRAMPAAADMRQAKAAVHAEWTLAVRRRSRRLRAWSLIGAAAVAASVTGILIWNRLPEGPPPAVDIASVQRLTGTLVLAGGTPERRVVTEVGARVRSGDRVEIPAGAGAGASVRLASGIVVRLNHGTEGTFAAVDRLVLHSGAVYIDASRAHGAERGPGLRVETAFGEVRHLGTKFEVRVEPNAMRVRVRDGAVALENRSGRWVGTAGEALTIAADRPPDRQRIDTDGAEWAWVAALAEPFQLEGATLPAFLEWVSREEGWEWRIEDPALRARAERIVLHGSIDGLTAAEALEAVLPASGLTFRLTGDRLVVTVMPRSSGVR